MRSKHSFIVAEGAFHKPVRCAKRIVPPPCSAGMQRMHGLQGRPCPRHPQIKRSALPFQPVPKTSRATPTRIAADAGHRTPKGSERDTGMQRRLIKRAFPLRLTSA